MNAKLILARLVPTALLIALLVSMIFMIAHQRDGFHQVATSKPLGQSVEIAIDFEPIEIWVYQQNKKPNQLELTLSAKLPYLMQRLANDLSASELQRLVFLLKRSSAHDLAETVTVYYGYWQALAEIPKTANYEWQVIEKARLQTVYLGAALAKRLHSSDQVLAEYFVAKKQLIENQVPSEHYNSLAGLQRYFREQKGL